MNKKKNSERFMIFTIVAMMCLSSFAVSSSAATINDSDYYDITAHNAENCFEEETFKGNIIQIMTRSTVFINSNPSTKNIDNDGIEEDMILENNFIDYYELGDYNDPIVTSYNDGVWVNVTKEVFPTDIHPCKPATIAINVTAEGDPLIESVPVAVMLVIDISGSMDWAYENETGVSHPALYYVKNAANVFIDQMDLTNDTVGVVSFARNSNLEQGLTHNGNLAKTAINELDANGYTNTGAGIYAAQQELEANCPDDTIPIILLMTDGLPTRHNSGTCETCPTSNNTCTDHARNNANDAKNADTTIYTIGFTGAIENGGCDSDSVMFAKWLLKDIASGEDYFYDAPDVTDFEEIYMNISQTVSNVAITDLVVSDFLPDIFTIINDGGGMHTVLPDGSHNIEFTRSFLALNDSWNIEFDISTEEMGDWILTNFANSNLTYIQDGTEYRDFLPYPKYINVTNPLEIEKNAPPHVNLYQNFEYIINITNIGHMNLNNVMINDPLPNEVIFNNVESDYAGFDSSNWNYDSILHTLDIYDVPLNIGEKIEFSISVTANSVSDEIHNTVYGGYSVEGGCTIIDLCNSSVITSTQNFPPTANDDIDSCDEDGSTWTFVLDNDVDIEGPLDYGSLHVTNSPSNGSTIVNTTTGEIKYTPDPNWYGLDTYVYSIADESGANDSATVSITVFSVDDFPDAANDNANTDEDAAVIIDVTGNDDFGGDGASTGMIFILTPPSHGAATVEDGGTPNDPTDDSIDYAPDADWNGNDQLVYRIEDADGDTDTATVSITVFSVDDFPDAANDNANTDEDAAVIIDVTGNDDFGGDGASTGMIFILTPPSHGAATVEDGGTPNDPTDDSIEYKSYAGWNGYDVLVYQIEDADGDTDNATVSISVGDVNDPPVADANGPYGGFSTDAITLDGSGSFDNDGYITNYEWIINGSTLYNGVSATFDLDLSSYSVGVYSVELIVTDDDLFNDSDTTILNVGSPPVADVGGPYDNDYGDFLVHFDGSESYDIDGEIVNYTWDFGDGSTGFGVQPNHSYEPTTGIYVITLTVEDNDGLTDSDSTSVKFYPEDEFPAIVQIISPEDNDIVGGIVMVEWFAIDDTLLGEELPIYLFYSPKGMDYNWHRVTEPVCNNVDLEHGNYAWDVNGLSDGEYTLLVEAAGTGGIGTDSVNIKVSGSGTSTHVDVNIIDTTIESSGYVKNGDSVEITAAITGLDASFLTNNEITADLSGFGLGIVPAKSYNKFEAVWTIPNVQCQSEGTIAITVFAGDDASGSTSIIADNTDPTLSLKKPTNGIYFYNSLLFPFTDKIIIFGPIDMKLGISDENGVDRATIVIDNVPVKTINDPPFKWYMNQQLTGRHKLEVIGYDHAGNSIEISQMITVFNFFGN